MWLCRVLRVCASVDSEVGLRSFFSEWPVVSRSLQSPSLRRTPGQRKSLQRPARKAMRRPLHVPPRPGGWPARCEHIAQA
eukprot:9421296-Alexandrium_andersonii.AAC.1